MTSRKTRKAAGRGGRPPRSPPPRGGATSPPRSRPRPCLQRREGQRPAGPWRAGASRRRHVTGRRPRPGVWLRHGGPHRDGPQGQPHEGRGRGWGRRAVTGCSHGAVPSGHLFPGELWLRKSDSVPRPNRPNPGPPTEVQPTKVKGRRSPLGTAAMSAWAGFSPPRRDRGTQGRGRPSTARGERRGDRVEVAGCHSQRPHQGGSWVLPPPCGQGPWPGSSSGILARVPTCPRHLSSGVSVGSCSTQGPQVLCKAAPRGLISMWPSGEAALLCDKFITCGIVLVGYEKSAVAW